MVELRPIGRSATVAGFVLGRKPDGIPFSAYHAMVIAVLVEGGEEQTFVGYYLLVKPSLGA
jgi:hypothetical protein